MTNCKMYCSVSSKENDDDDDDDDDDGGDSNIYRINHPNVDSHVMFPKCMDQQIQQYPTRLRFCNQR